MDLDPDKVTNNMDEAALQAELMKDFRGTQQEQAQPQAPAGVDPNDPQEQVEEHRYRTSTYTSRTRIYRKVTSWTTTTKQILSQLKTLVNNPKLINHFNDYLDYKIDEQHKIMEQSDDSISIHRAQGYVMATEKIKTT